MKKTICFIVAIIALSAFISCSGKFKDREAKVIFTAKAPKPIGPYSQAVQVGRTLYISGQIAIDPATGNLDTADISIQTKRVMENLKAILNEAKMDFSDVVKTSVFLTDLNNFAKVNDIYGQYFTENPPARETVKVAGLPKNVGIEISMIAHK